MFLRFISSHRTVSWIVTLILATVIFAFFAIFAGNKKEIINDDVAQYHTDPITRKALSRIIYSKLKRSTAQQKEMLVYVIWRYGYLKNDINPLDVISLIATESWWSPVARNKWSGARGMMQHLPGLWRPRRRAIIRLSILPKWYRNKYGTSWYEPTMNVAAGIWYLLQTKQTVKDYTNKRGRGYYKTWIISYYSGANGAKRFITHPSKKQLKYFKTFEGYRQRYQKLAMEYK